MISGTWARRQKSYENEIDFHNDGDRSKGVLVCHCRRVNDRTIRAVARAGARSCDDVGAACGAGTGCGGCRPAIEGLIVSERAAEGGASLPVIRAPEPGT